MVWTRRAALYGLAAILVALAGIGVAVAIARSSSSSSAGAADPNPFTADRTIVEGVELDRDGNGRFNFWFSYPYTWIRLDSENGDGSAFQEPSVGSRVSVSFSGMHRLSEFGDDSEMLETERRRVAQNSNVSGGYAGSWVWQQDSDFKTVSRQEIGGSRFVFDETLADGTLMRTIERSVYAEDRVLSISATAPVALFDDYEAVFNYLVADFRVYEPAS